MLWITIMMVVCARAEVSPNEDAPANRFLLNELSVTFDHCREPQRLNRDTWTCECPSGLRKDGDDCVCDGCLFSANNETYVERDSNVLPEYLAPFLKNLHDEEEEERQIAESGGGVGTRMLWGGGGGGGEGESKWKKFKLRAVTRERIRQFQSQLMSVLRAITRRCGDEGGVRPRILIARKGSALSQFLRGLRVGLRKPKKIRFWKVDWRKSRILNLGKMRKEEEREKDEEGATFSETSVGGEANGAVRVGQEKAYGAVSNLYGTGSISLGAGQGSAAASAFTGEGASVAGVESSGGKAFGVGLIGRKATRGTSTTSLLVGQGDAIATNSRSAGSSASATAIATKKTATAGSTAFGEATAAASAAPGKGSANGSATYGEGLTAAAMVTAKETSPVAETVAVGNADDNLQHLIQAQRERNLESRLEEDFVGGRKGTGTEFDFFSDGDSISDWLL